MLGLSIAENIRKLTRHRRVSCQHVVNYMHSNNLYIDGRNCQWVVATDTGIVLHPGD
jgi:hypothetical protein